MFTQEDKNYIKTAAMRMYGVDIDKVIMEKMAGGFFDNITNEIEKYKTDSLLNKMDTDNKNGEENKFVSGLIRTMNLDSYPNHSKSLLESLKGTGRDIKTVFDNGVDVILDETGLKRTANVFKEIANRNELGRTMKDVGNVLNYLPVVINEDKDLHAGTALGLGAAGIGTAGLLHKVRNARLAREAAALSSASAPAMGIMNKLRRLI